MKFERRLLAAVVITTMFMNAGNLGLPLNLFAFGETALTLASAIRLLAAPALALGLCGVFGMQGVARQAGVLESAMPTAVLSTVLATEYDVEPTFVTSVVFITTLLSPLTLTPLLAYLGG